MGKRGVGDVFLTAFFPRPLPHRFLFVLGSAFARLNLVLYEPQKKKDSKRTASYAGYYTASFFFQSLLVSDHIALHLLSAATPKRSYQKFPKKLLQCPLASNLKIYLRVLSLHVLQVLSRLHLAERT